MNSINRKSSLGYVMIIVFFVVLGLIFAPVFKGQNGLDYLDGLFNSIAKGSAYYIPELMEKSKKLEGKEVVLDLAMATEKEAGQTAMLFQAAGAAVNHEGSTIKVSGDLGAILKNSLEDADIMYANNGAGVSGKYGYEERLALLNWWKAFKEADKNLKKQKKFKEADLVSMVMKKAVETSYNYYGIEARSIMSEIGVVVFALVFYVVYTVWYGFAILFMFEGNGFKVGH